MIRIRNLLICAPAAAACLLLCSFTQDYVSPGGQFLIYSVLYFAIAAVALKLYKGSEPLDPFAPILPTFALFYLYSAASAINTVDTGAIHQGESVSRDILNFFYICCLMGLIGLAAGFVLGKGTRVGIGIPGSFRERLSDRRTLSKLMWAAPLLGLLCASRLKGAFDFLHVKSYVETALSSRVEKMEMGASQPLGEVFLYNIPLALLLMLGLLLLFRSRNLLGRLAGAALLSAHAATVLLSGQRSNLAMLGTLALIFVHYRVKRIGIWTLVVVFIAGFVMTGIVDLVRFTNNPVEMASILAESVARGDTSFLKLGHTGEFLVGQNLMRLLIGMRDGETTYTYGESVISELLVFIPRALYRDRPLPLSGRFLDVFYPGLREAGAGYGSFYLTDGYWAFGLVGVLLFMIAHACVVQWIYKAFTENGMTDGTALWWAYLIYVLVFLAVRMGTVGMFKPALINSLPFLLLYFIPTLRLATRPSPVVQRAPSEA